MPTASALVLLKGKPFPLGLTIDSQGANFALFARHASQVKLCLFQLGGTTPWAVIPLDALVHKTGDIWHVRIENIPDNILYGYEINGPQNAIAGFDYHVNVLLLDPYAKAVSTPNVWGLHSHLPLKQQPDYQPLGAFPSPFDWGNDTPPHIPMQDLIVYEMHVRGYTAHPSSEVADKGTFLGLIEKIPHLLDLGVNAIELLPIQEFNEMEWKHYNPKTKERLFNYWGYSTVNYFAPMNRYGSNPKPGSVVNEFRTMVKALHAAGIEVILDVVFNHTAEGDKLGPVISFKGIDCPIYYMMNQKEFLDYSGCGNTVNCNHPIVRQFILDCLRYWVTEMHVDGFRFDLASIFSRDQQGIPVPNAPLIEEITEDPLLANVKLIAEPWDATGLYEVGHFYPSSARWTEWNGKYRDSVRRFIKGSPGQKGEFATRLCGSEDLYYGRSPLCSLNYVTAHDGFTLNDLVSYNQKHNFDNGEHNRDGFGYNDSWNCGFEGPAASAKIHFLRQRQMRNFHLALMLSQGVPMLLMGDEYGHTKLGNNNTWCQDNELNWFLWDKLSSNPEFYRFYKMMIHFRKSHRILKRTTFMKDKDIEWHGLQPLDPNWGHDLKFLAFTLKDASHEADLYAAFNASDANVVVTLPEPKEGSVWKMIVNTGLESPQDIVDEHEALVLNESVIKMIPHSAVMLVQARTI